MTIIFKEILLMIPISKRFDFMNKKLKGTNNNSSSPLKQGG